MYWTCHHCGNEFRRKNQFEFFCTNMCRGKEILALGLTSKDFSLGDLMDDLAMVMYKEYLNEINDNNNKRLIVQ